MKNEYILVYNGKGTFPACYEDLHELLVEVYDSPNVIYSDFKGNLDDLNPQTTTLAIPGGSLFQIACSLTPHISKLTRLFDSGSKGVFVCSGTYFAANHADVFNDEYRVNVDTGLFKPPNCFASINTGLNIIQNFKAYGPFVANECWNTYSPEKLQNRAFGKPCATRIRIQSTGTAVNQIYWGGCGLELIPDAATNRPCEVLATYHDKNCHSFFYPGQNQTKTIHNMAAIVGRKGLVASGVHIETCVKSNSKVLEAATRGERDSHALPMVNRDDYDRDHELAREAIIPMLRHYLVG